MPFNPETDATQVLSKPYKQALVELAAREKRGLQQQMEFLILQACLARGIHVNPPKPAERKEKGTH